VTAQYPCAYGEGGRRNIQEQICARKIVNEKDFDADRQVGSSATLGTGTDFAGNILAGASISDDGGSTVDGRLLALNGEVSLIETTIDAPQASPEDCSHRLR